MSYGLIQDSPKPGDYIQGGPVRLGGAAIMPSGQWDAFLPPDELQAQYVEPEACASFGTLNCVEILERQEFGSTTNWSDRFLAKVSGTTQAGNSPHTVAEALRKNGVCFESDWPYTPDINTWEKFYSPVPLWVGAEAQAEFTGSYDFGHQWVGTTAQAMVAALQYSPLGVDVFAWNVPDGNGVYHRNGLPSNHWVCVYGYVPNQYWKCFDTYNNTHKKLAWDFGFTMVKQYTLHRQVLKDNVFFRALQWLRQFIGLSLIPTA